VGVAIRLARRRSRDLFGPREPLASFEAVPGVQHLDCLLLSEEMVQGMRVAWGMPGEPMVASPVYRRYWQLWAIILTDVT